MEYLITYFVPYDMVVKQKIVKEIFNSAHDLRMALETLIEEEKHSFDIVSIVPLPYTSTTNYFKEIERN